MRRSKHLLNMWISPSMAWFSYLCDIDRSCVNQNTAITLINMIIPFSADASDGAAVDEMTLVNLIRTTGIWDVFTFLEQNSGFGWVDFI